jgi:pimeloyl-ACP methyl ester carboxylesterase
MGHCAGWVPPGEPFPDAREYASPIRYVAPDNIPQLILHSDDDPSIPIEQVLRMVAALAGGAVLHCANAWPDCRISLRPSF